MNEPICLSVARAVELCGGAISRTALFALLKTGKVESRLIGGRRAIMADSLRQFIRGETSDAEP